MCCLKLCIMHLCSENSGSVPHLWQPHQLVLPLRVCELRVKTELVQKCSCKLCDANVTHVSGPFPCSDRLLSFQISLIGAPSPAWQLPELRSQRKQFPKCCVCLWWGLQAVLRLGFCLEKTIRFSLGSVRTQIKEGIYANIYVNATKPLTWPHGAGVAEALNENFFCILALMYVSCFKNLR